MQRKHFVTKETGYARAVGASTGPKGIPPSVASKIKEARECA